MNNNLPIRVLTSFAKDGEDNPGTIVCEEDDTMEARVVSGVAVSKDEAQITLLRLNNTPGVVANVCKAMANENIMIDMIVQGRSLNEDAANLTFTVGERDLAKAVTALETLNNELGFKEIRTDNNVVKVSVVGVGMRSHTGVAQTMFDALAAEGINIEVIATSEIKISVLVDSKYRELAVRALHEAFELEKA